MIFWSGLSGSKDWEYGRRRLKGAYNRVSHFKGKNYVFWKENMCIHLMWVDKYLWVTTSDKPFFPGNEVDNFVKLPKDWTDDETKKALYDLKARNILIFELSAKVYYSISHHKSAQTMWNSLQVLYEGTEDVKDSKINMSIEECGIQSYSFTPFNEQVRQLRKLLL